MAKLVVLKFSGSLKSGLEVTSAIGLEGKSVERGCTGSLPPATELDYYLHTWQQHYNRLGNNYRIKPQQIIYNGSRDPYRQLIELAARLQQELLSWLSSPGFRKIDRHLREELNRHESSRILICSDRPEIYQLPWCCWDLLESYPDLEIAVSNPNFSRIPIVTQQQQHRQVKVLAILGNGEGLNLEADRAFLNTIDAEVELAIEPTISELYERLWNETWDIVFFAGHSRTLERQGILYLNARDRLTIEQLRHGFKRAIASGLQLAIFNSCDGLGLAEELGRLSLPQSIVMRLPIPDEMAQQFVKSFLQAYAGGSSLYLAMRKAREKLQSLEQNYPCASWLPVIYQNPAVIPPRWSDFTPPNKLISFNRQLRPLMPPLIATVAIAAIATTIVWLMQFWGWLAAGELRAYDRLMIWGYSPPVDEKVLVITVDEQDRRYQREQGMMVDLRGSLADPALNRLLQKLNLAGAKAIASDIIHDFPFDANLAETIAQTENYVSICRINNSSQLVSVAPPPQLKPQQLGFSNWAIDDDGTIRRQILGMSPDSICPGGYSLSLRLALKYLGDVNARFDARSRLTIADAAFPRLQEVSGGYNLPEAQGYQILLNYRRAFPQTVTLREILASPQAKINSLVKDRIVLIGVVGHNHDLHHTPYSRGQQAKRLPGVVIHALMTSQIIDLVSGVQKPIGWVSCRIEIVWIALWSIVGTIIISIERKSPFKIAIAIVIALALLFTSCWLMLLGGIWLIAIAPALALILAAALTLVYLNNAS